MSIFNPQAQDLNKIIRQDNPAIYQLLSEKGKALYFPKEGILAQTKEAKGKKINATIGTGVADDGSPIYLPSIAKNLRIDPKDAFFYAPSYGKEELRTAWKKLIYQKNPSLKTPVSTPVVTSALTHGLSLIGLMFMDPGDNLVLADKYWGNYKLIFNTCYGAILNTYNTFSGAGFDLNSFTQKLHEDSGKLIILLNFPNNPAGYTPTHDEAEKILGIIEDKAKKGTKVLVIVDDAYFGLVYKKNIYQESLFAQLSNRHQNILAVKIDGSTKEDYVWGFRVGYITYGAKGVAEKTYLALEAKTAGGVRSTISNASHLSQSLILKAYDSPKYYQEKREKYLLLKDRFEEVEKVLQNDKFTRFFTALPFNSGYFMCVELKKGLDGEIVRKLLLEKFDTGVISIENILRIAYSSLAKKDISGLFENIYTACKILSE